MDVTVWRDGNKYTLHFAKGKIKGKMLVEPSDRKKTGTTTRWKPDIEVFTDINIPESYFLDILRRQAVVNAGVTFRFRAQHGAKFETTEFCYKNGIADYVAELAGRALSRSPITSRPRERAGTARISPNTKVRMSAAFCFSNRTNAIEYYHNSSWLRARRRAGRRAKTAFVYAIDAYIKKTNKYQKNESKITFPDIADCLILVTNCFSTRTSYETRRKNPSPTASSARQ